MSSYREIKIECYEANLLLPEYRLIDLTFGNVSIANHARGVFAIKPSGVDYHRMKPEDMVVVDLEGRTVEGSLRHRHLRLTTVRIASCRRFQSSVFPSSNLTGVPVQVLNSAKVGRPWPTSGPAVPVTSALNQPPGRFALDLFRSIFRY